MWPQCCVFASGKAIAVASKTLKITHLDLASKGGSEGHSWAKLKDSGAKAWARFPAPDRFGTGRLGCWHNLVAGSCLVRAHQNLQLSNQGTEVVSFAWMIDTEYYRRFCTRSSGRGRFE